MSLIAAALVAVFLLSQAAIVAAFLVARDRAEQRHAQERAAERDANRQDIQLLLQRIQAPDVAVAQHAQEHVEDAGYIPPNDDEAFWKLQEQLVA